MINMALPRLPASTQPYRLQVDINEKLRPYFEIWYQKTKQPSDTPQSFALRVLKVAAMNDYIQANISAEHEAMQNDINLIGTEVD
jgi:hypothetical protein